MPELQIPSWLSVRLNSGRLHSWRTSAQLTTTFLFNLSTFMEKLTPAPIWIYLCRRFLKDNGGKIDLKSRTRSSGWGTWLAYSQLSIQYPSAQSVVGMPWWLVGFGLGWPNAQMATKTVGRCLVGETRTSGLHTAPLIHSTRPYFKSVHKTSYQYINILSVELCEAEELSIPTVKLLT